MKSFQLAVDSERSVTGNETPRISDRPKNVRGKVRPSSVTSASRVRKKLTPSCSSSWRGARSDNGGSSSDSRSPWLWRTLQDSAYDTRSGMDYSVRGREVQRLIDPAHDGPRLQRERDGRVRGSASGGRFLMATSKLCRSDA